MSILVSGLCMPYHFSYYLPSTQPGLRYLYSYSCSYIDIDCSGIAVSSLLRSPIEKMSPEVENRVSFQNVVFSSF
jgi:hypothetical protein